MTSTLTFLAHKVPWQGTLTAVQPRIRLTRSFDQRSHTYLGYVLRLNGSVEDQPVVFKVAIGSGAQEKHWFRVDDVISGESLPVPDSRLEVAAYYQTSKLKVVNRPERLSGNPPPWREVPPDLSTYRQRGHRRLDARTYDARCQECIWGCQMPVEMMIDQWNPGQRRYRYETFCYGPKSCPIYRPGPTRKVPGRRGMSWEEADWVDDEATAHRSEDE